MSRDSAVMDQSSKAEGQGALVRYVIAAALARSADGGAVVAVVLLVVSHGGSGGLAGLLGACITAPHMLGPLLARKIDLVQDARKVISFACGLYAFAFSSAVLTYGSLPFFVTGALLAVAGCCGPLLTGGISSRLPAIVAADQKSQRRAQAWDVATYGIGGTIGPSIVAVVSAYASSSIAAYCLAGASLFAAWMVMRLPYASPSHGGDPASVPGVWSTIKMMLGNGYLRRTLYMTMLVAFSMAALPITAVQMTSVLGVGASSAAVMTAAYGIGNLTGSIGVMIKPLKGAPDLLISRLAVLVLLGLSAVLFSTSFYFAVVSFWFAGILNAFFFASTLAARSEYAPLKVRGQVFLWVAALKITAGSAGTATAGALIGLQMSIPIAAGLTLISFGIFCCIYERRFEDRSKNCNMEAD